MITIQMKKLMLYSAILISFLGYAQKKEKDKTLPLGNEAYVEKRYAEAEADYRISQSKFNKKAIASYNLANSIYKQKQITEAKAQFVTALKKAKSKTEKHRVYHNLGNCLMTEKEYAGAVEAYKNALRNNPLDEETRYNYALAKQYLKNNPPKQNDDKGKDKKNQKDQQKQDKDKDKNKDQNQNKDGDKEKDKQNQEGNQKKDKDNSNKEGGKPQQSQGGMSKERVKNLLDAVNNEEKKIQDKVNKQKAITQPKKAEKDW
jgi:tetratricopeptide (TPR) repeat protein